MEVEQQEFTWTPSLSKTALTRKRGGSLSHDATSHHGITDDIKRFKLEHETRQNEPNEMLMTCDIFPNVIPTSPAALSPLLPIVEAPFEEIGVAFGQSSYRYRNDVTNIVYDTIFVEDVPASTHLRAILNASNPLPSVALRVQVFVNPSDGPLFPKFALRVASKDVPIECTGVLSSDKFPVIPAEVKVETANEEDGSVVFTTEIDASPDPEDLVGSVLTLKYHIARRCIATVVCDFEHTYGQPVMGLYKLQRRSRTSEGFPPDSSIVSSFKQTRGARYKTSGSTKRGPRCKPNLSLAIPPPSNVLMRAATGNSTPSTGGQSLYTPLDQRIKTPLAPPALTIEVDPRRLQMYAATPTDMLSPSLYGKQTASSALTKLTKFAMAAGTPGFMKDGMGLNLNLGRGLASPLVSVGAKPMRRSQSQSYCSTPSASEKPTTPGGYFRTLA